MKPTWWSYSVYSGSRPPLPVSGGHHRLWCHSQRDKRRVAVCFLQHCGDRPGQEERDTVEAIRASVVHSCVVLSMASWTRGLWWLPVQKPPCRRMRPLSDTGQEGESTPFDLPTVARKARHLQLPAFLVLQPSWLYGQP